MRQKVYPPFWMSLQADTIRQCGTFSIWLFLKTFLLRRVFRPIVTMRLCQAVYSSSGLLRFFLLGFKLIHRWTTHWAGIDLPWETVIGPGFCITNGWGLVVTPGATIGKNVTLFHGVTLGRRDRIARDGSRVTDYPVLEDQVWIGPHAIIVGGVTIGRGSRVAGGAFVTESVPPFTVVGGNPAVILKTNAVPDVSNPAPIGE